MESNFQQRIYNDVKRLFPAGSVDVLVARPFGPGKRTEKFDASVRLVHKASGKEVTCGDFPSQIENYIAAAIQLRIECDRSNG